MKIKAKLLLALILCCITVASAACGGSAPSGEANASPETTAAQGASSELANTSAPDATEAAATEAAGEKSYCVDYKSVMWSNVVTPTMAETDDTLYLLADKIIYFTDKGYKDWMPLCARPDCKHDNANCNAYIDSESLILYDKYLYYIEGGGQQFDDEKPRYKVKLCRMGLDGSAHEEVFDIREQLEPEHSYKVASSSWDVEATGKYLIIRISLGEYRASGNFIPHRFYYSLDLETLQFVPMLTEYSNDPNMGGFTLFEGRGSSAYGVMNFLNDDPYRIVEIDLASGNTREICECGKKIAYWERCVGMIDGKLYYAFIDSPDPEDGYTEEQKIHLYKLDLDTGETDLVEEATAIYSPWMVLDSDAGYWYSTVGIGDEEKMGTYVCDIERNLIDFIPASDYPEEIGGWLLLGRVTQDYIFAMARNAAGGLTGGAVPIWYLNKADIGTDNLMWRKWEP